MTAKVFTHFLIGSYRRKITPRMVNKISNSGSRAAPQCLSIGILAWNEEESIGQALTCLFRQSLFAHLKERHLRCEILCVANGCTDRTAAIAKEIFEAQNKNHPFKETFSGQCIELTERGKVHAWNKFVHELSAPEAQALCLLDGDIVLHHPETLWNMYCLLETNAEALIATDRPLKDLAFKAGRSVRERLSLAMSGMTQAAPAQLTGQLYCIRAAVARNIYLPRDLVACEDGFIKALVCSRFLTEAVSPRRVALAEDASHIFEAYTRPGDIIRNQKRQIMGQTVVHILIDNYLKALPFEEKLHLAERIRKMEREDPDWLKKLIAAHLARIGYFWRLFPDLLTFRFRRLAQLRGGRWLASLPAALAGFVVTLVSGWQAFHSLKSGSTQYWPDTKSPGLRDLAGKPIHNGNGLVRPSHSAEETKAAMPDVV